MKRILLVDDSLENLKMLKSSLEENCEVTPVTSALLAQNYLNDKKADMILFDASRQLTEMTLSTVITVANIVDAKDKYAGGHSLRVAMCAKSIAKNLGWTDEECQNLYNAVLLHDIGMISVPDTILNKPGRLENEEYEVIKKHPLAGNEILRDITVLPHLKECVLYHHERWDGKGYPFGKAGEDIPLYARVVAVADAYDAMSSDRIYRKHLSREKIISEFERGRGTQFDPELADVFVFMLKDGFVIDSSIKQSKESSENATNDGGLSLGMSLRAQGDVEESLQEDALTGLFTRSYLNTRVGNKIVSERAGALMLIGLDDFAKVNETFGEEIGNRVLHDFAKLLGSLFRDEDVICRLSGDHFAVFVSGQSGKAIIEKKAQMIIEAVTSSLTFASYRDIMGVSMGIALCPEAGITFEELYGSADEALKHVKENGKNSYKII